MMLHNRTLAMKGNFNLFIYDNDYRLIEIEFVKILVTIYLNSLKLEKPFN